MNRAILLYTEGYNGSSIQLGNKGFKIISAELPRPVSIHVLFSTIKYMTEIIHDDNCSYFDVDCHTLNIPEKIQTIRIHIVEISDMDIVYGVLNDKYLDNIVEKDNAIGL